MAWLCGWVQCRSVTSGRCSWRTSVTQLKDARQEENTKIHVQSLRRQRWRQSQWQEGTRIPLGFGEWAGPNCGKWSVVSNGVRRQPCGAWCDETGCEWVRLDGI